MLQTLVDEVILLQLNGVELLSTLLNYPRHGLRVPTHLYVFYMDGHQQGESAILSCEELLIALAFSDPNGSQHFLEC